MVRVSIVSLIYRSSALADWVYESVHKFTPLIARGEAEFFFVANDPTPGLLRHLQDKGYSHITNVNKRYSEEELFAQGFGVPEHMSRVYRGYNEGIRAAKGDYVVLVNSDNYFSPDWLENLLKYSDRSKVVTSTLVERDHPLFQVFPGAIHGEFGASPSTFDQEAFLSFAARIRQTGLEPGGAYMPALFHTDVAIEAGLYPCGNIAGDSFSEVAKYGDEAFYDVLESMGVHHYTSLDSIAYHLKEGERDDDATGDEASDEPVLAANGEGTTNAPYPAARALTRVLDSLGPTKRHVALMEALLTQEVASAEGTLRGRQKVERDAGLAGLAALAAEEEAAKVAAQQVLEAQAARFRGRVEKVLGPRLTGPAMTLVHSVSWIVHPLRRAMARARQR